MKSRENIKDFELIVNGNKTRSFDKISESLDRAYNQIDQKDNIIEGLQQKIRELEKEVSDLNSKFEQQAIQRNQKIVAFSRISQEAKIRYNELERLDFANVLSSKDFIKIDTIPQITVKWNRQLNDSVINLKEGQLRAWLQTELDLDTLFVKRETPVRLDTQE